MTGRIGRLQREFYIDVRWTAFPLHPETPDDGKTLEELFAGRGIDIGQMMDHLKQIADGLGLPLGDRKMTYNSRLAQELGKYSESMGKGDAFHHAMFRAYFVDGENIADVHVLVKVAISIGLDGDDARKVIEARAYSKAVDLDWKRSYELSVNAVPTFLFEDQVLVGAQKYETLAKLLLSKHVKRRY